MNVLAILTVAVLAVVFCVLGAVNVGAATTACQPGSTHSCVTIWGYNGTQACNKDCFGWNLCVSKEYCGDHIKNGDETCDGETACVINGYAGTRACKITCKDWKKDSDCVTTQYCGDLKKNGAEQCDGTNGVGAHQTCDASCNLVNVSYCGDGTVNQASEVCDGGSQPCKTADNYSGTQSCLDDCAGYSATCVATEKCGDGIKNGNEACDGTDGISGSQTCGETCQIQTVTGGGGSDQGSGDVTDNGSGTGDSGNSGNVGSGTDTGNTTPSVSAPVVLIIRHGNSNSSSGDWAPGFGPNAQHGRVLGASTERLPLDRIAAAIEIIKQIIAGMSHQVSAL